MSISNYNHYKCGINYLSNGAVVEVWGWLGNSNPHFYFSVLMLIKGTVDCSSDVSKTIQTCTRACNFTSILQRFTSVNSLALGICGCNFILELLERLCSEDTPSRLMITHTIEQEPCYGFLYWVILDPKSKEDKVKVTNLKNLPKLHFFEFWNKLYRRHTFCANMKWVRRVLLKMQMGHTSVHKRTDGRTD